MYFYDCEINTFYGLEINYVVSGDTDRESIKIGT